MLISIRSAYESLKENGKASLILMGKFTLRGQSKGDCRGLQKIHTLKQKKPQNGFHAALGKILS